MGGSGLRPWTLLRKAGRRGGKKKAGVDGQRGW
jgi:hypothetical protein